MLKYYLCLYLLLYLIQAFGQQTVIAKQGFESSGDHWPIDSISTPACTQGTDTWNTHTSLGDIVPHEGSFFWGIQDLNGNCGSAGFEFIQFETVDISGYRNVSLSFKVIVKGYDNGDDMKYQLWLDGIPQPEVFFIEGQNDLSLDNWTSVNLEIPNAISLVQLRISIKQNGADIAGIDSFKIIGDPKVQCAQLMISEYIEGSSSVAHRNNYIELYNPRNTSQDLSDFQLVKYTNNNTEPSAVLELSGTLGPYTTFLIEDSKETLEITADLSTNSSVLDFNGDDKISLQKSDTIIDLIGQIGDSISFGKDISFRRKSSIQTPNNQYNPKEWDSYGMEDTADLGRHASYCQGALPEIELYGLGTPIQDGNRISSLTNNTYFDAYSIAKDTLIQKTFTIKNTGNDDLIIDQVRLSGPDKDLFSLPEAINASIMQKDSLSFTVSYRPARLGVHTAVIEISNNDPSEDVFDFVIQGEGTGQNTHPLMITQYYEGSGNNKWIEITNISSVNSPENTYFLALYRNEDTQHPIGTKPYRKKLIPSIGPGNTIKFCATLNVSMPSYALDGNEVKTTTCSFTGDDILIISTADDESSWAHRTDIIGRSGNWGQNLSMVRNYGCISSLPDTGFDPDQWQEYAIDVIDSADVGQNQRIGIHKTGATIWKDGLWTNGKPDKFMNAILEGQYHTSSHGNLEACDLHILEGASLIVDRADYLFVRQNLRVDGALDILDEGTLLMENNQALIDHSGSIRIYKTTTDLKPFDYTFWSSPVEHSVLETVFKDAPKNAIYLFETQNFQDQNKDGLDDDNNAWVRASGDMQIGRGYISMAPETTPFQENQTVLFEGKVSNGRLKIPVFMSHQDAPEAHHWNLIGNPYPSGIDAELLLNHPLNDHLLGKTLYFWTHSTPANIDGSSTDQMYAANDYAMYTLGTGGVKASPNGKTPTQFISSCQGFFVDAKKHGELYVDNSMRTRDGYDQFFKPIKTKNKQPDSKIWLNLSNDEGAFSQLLIGFIAGASRQLDTDFDGERMDANNYINFYSLSGNKQLAIQGLPPFQIKESIPIGFHNRIQKETSLEISIDHLKGDLKSEDIVLHDKKLDQYHDLKSSPYSFIQSEPGNIDHRFELMLGDHQFEVMPSSPTNKLKIIWRLNESTLKIRTSNLDLMKKIEIFDLNGRVLKNMDVHTDRATINWKGFPTRTIFLLRVQLADSRNIVTKIFPKG